MRLLASTVPTATLFKHFATKGQVLVAVIEREWSAAAPDPLTLERSDQSDIIVGAGLSTIAETFVRFLRLPGTTALFRLIIAEAPSVSQLAQLGSFVDGAY